MKDMVLIAGHDRFEVGLIRRCLRKSGYDSIPCRTMGMLVEEMNVLPTCRTNIALVIIDPVLLCAASADLLDLLSNCAMDVPIMLMGKAEQEEAQERYERICGDRVVFNQEEHILGEIL